MTTMHDITTLVRKYDVPGPRYTSYPTVPAWSTTPTEEQWLASLAQALTEGDGYGASVYVHVPFCESLCTYCGCTTRITKKKSVSAPYVDSLLTEWQRYREGLARHGQTLRLGALHLGGGTPTFLPADELARLVKGLCGDDAVAGAELSIEADPRVTTDEQLATLAQLGFRRLSLGVQDFDPIVQDIINRNQSEEQVRVVTESARRLGFESVNYDLVYGLPLQTCDGLARTIQTVVALAPDRVAFYGYAHVPWLKPGQRRFTEADLPTGEERRKLYELGRELLVNAGYREIGLDHFALPSDPLWKAHLEGTLHRSFMGYTERPVEPLIGLGVSAIGDSGRAFAQNAKVLEAYQERLAAGDLPIVRGHVLDAEDLELRAHIHNLMTRFETTWTSQSPAVALLTTLPGRLDEMAADGLIELGPGYCRVTAAGQPFVRNVCMAFDAHLIRGAATRPATPMFSRTV